MICNNLLLSDEKKDSKEINMANIKQIAKEIRKDIIRMTYAAGKQGAHMGGSLSMCEIMAVLYHDVMSFDVNSENRDRFILSKGHGAIALYAVLKSLGLFTEDELLTYKQDDSIITAHPTYLPTKGMEFASGSLGQGLSLGVGVALGLRKKGNHARVFVLIGDGESDEGSVWEAAASASHYQLSNLTCIVDQNMFQYDGATCDIMNMNNLSDKFISFGWDAKTVDGHDVLDISNALKRKSNKPKAIICKTIKGKGVSFAENNYKWHNASLTTEQYELALEEQED